LSLLNSIGCAKTRLSGVFLAFYSSVEWLRKGASIPSSIRFECVAKKDAESITFLY
jgi:hypothetical protein